ncbi:choline-phosphate cytidylyltransferase [Basidiobolus ranarum]|uniref:choline-phosphate cytidylyltransferase n=1 Tax=Basidiobolus ranarum TaxID=34480 RepID=A0ABR2WV28_9FUNG
MSTATKGEQEEKTPSENILSEKEVEQPSLTNFHTEDPWGVPTNPNFQVNPPPRDRAVRIYCDGIYDLFHFGHAKALEQAKKAFPNVYLLVGVCSDELTHKRKGKTVLTDQERYESLRHCKWVDEVIEDAPWYVTQEFLDQHQIDYVAHDDIPYVSAESTDVYDFVKKQGKFLPTKRTEGVSTSDLITRIVHDYDEYLRRNLERGISAKDLGISFFKEQELNVKKQVSGIRDTIRQNWHGTRDEIKYELDEFKNEVRQTFQLWEDRSQEFVRGFTNMFGTESVVHKILRIKSPNSTSPITSDDEDQNDGQGKQHESDPEVNKKSPDQTVHRSSQ